MKVLIAAAGTAGHINPAISIANKIMEEEKDSKIIFIGTNRGLENDLVPRAGYELRTIEAYGLSKKISIDNLKKMYKTFKGIGEAKAARYAAASSCVTPIITMCAKTSRCVLQHLPASWRRRKRRWMKPLRAI